jgi:hypothetical protein
MREIKGNLFDAENLGGEQRIMIPHVCNDKGAWGAGFVMPLARYFPEAKERYFQSVNYKGTGSLPLEQMTTQFVLCGYQPQIIVANMIAQTLGGDRPLSYESLTACMTRVGNHAVNTDCRIVCPKFGSGLAGGNWEFIKELIKDFWVDRGIDVTVFYL